MAQLDLLRDYGGVVLDGQTLGWPTARAGEVVEILRRFRLDPVLAVLLRLNLALTHHRPLDQEDLLGKWLQPDLAGVCIRLMREKRITHAFHEGQVLNLIRLAILNSPEDGELHCNQPGDFHLLMRALLRMSDLMFPHPGGTSIRDGVFSNFTRSELFMHDEQYVPHAMARNYDLFVMLPRIVGRRGSFFDIAGSFLAITGMDVEDYVGLGFGLLTQYDTIDAAIIANAQIGLQKKTYLESVHLPAERRNRLWPLLSKPIAEYRDALRTEWGSGKEPDCWFAMRTFSQFPMIEFADGTMVAVSRRLLRDRITHGIYWILANGVAPGDRQGFTNFFGDVFEEYIRRCFLRSLGHSFAPRARYGPARVPLVDGGLITTRSLGLVECKAGRLLLNVREVGSEADLLQSVEPGLERAASQLAAAVDGGQRGQIDGIETNMDTHFYPIVVTYEAIPSHPLAGQLYDRIVHRNGRLVGRDIKPVTLLNTRDIEWLEGLIVDGEAWADVISRKHSERYRLIPFHNYLYDSFEGAIPVNHYLRSRWGRIGNLIGTRLFGEPLAGPPPVRRRRRRGWKRRH